MIRSTASKVVWVGRVKQFAALLAVMVALVLGYATTAYAAPGDLDTSFGVGGKTTTDFANNPDFGSGGVALQEDGKAVVAGHGSPTGDGFALARYNANGTLGLPPVRRTL